MFQTPQRKRDRTCEDMRESLRKMGRKTSGVKCELEGRLEKALNTNSGERLTRGTAVAGQFTYLASGAHRHVDKGVYSKGPRKNQHCVSKYFKTGSVYEDTFFEEDVRAVSEVGKIVQAFNALGHAKTVYVNEPSVWADLEPDSTGKKCKSLVEPFIEGEYRKFNSNTSYIDESYHTMQALSHFSYHHSGGSKVVLDLQGGYYEDYYVLTDPVVCSTCNGFGVTDLGAAGISNFFAHHRCNHRCQSSWLKPSAPVRHFQPVSGTSFVPRVAR